MFSDLEAMAYIFSSASRFCTVLAYPANEEPYNSSVFSLIL